MGKDNGLLALCAILIYVLITLFHLASAKAGFSHYRDLHLGTAIQYSKGTIDLLRPVIVGFNATGTPTPQELPLWQATAGAVFKMLGPWLGWANLISLIFFAGGLWPLYQLSRKYLGPRGAWWALIFFLAQPLVILISGQASADGLSFVFALWFLFFVDKLVEDGRPVWLIGSIVSGSLSAITKLPLYMSVGLTGFFMLLFRAPRSQKRWGLLPLTGLASSVVFFAWTHYTEGCLAQAEFPYVDLSLSRNPDMWYWYFGNWHYRLNLFNWGKGGWAALNSLFGSFALVALAVWGWFRSPGFLPRGWLLAAGVTTLIFSHLVLVHRHYFILFSPAVAMLCAAGFIGLEESFDLRQGWKGNAMTLLCCAVLLLSSVQGLIGIKDVLTYDHYPHEVAQIVAHNTTPHDKLLIAGGGWGGEILFLSDRSGLTIDTTRLVENKDAFSRLSSLGYNKLVVISESPLLHALQVIDPGNLEKERISYRKALTPVADPWKTIFSSDDILIKELPGRTE